MRWMGGGLKKIKFSWVGGVDKNGRGNPFQSKFGATKDT